MHPPVTLYNIDVPTKARFIIPLGHYPYFINFNTVLIESALVMVSVKVESIVCNRRDETTIIQTAYLNIIFIEIHLHIVRAIETKALASSAYFGGNNIFFI